MALQPQEATPRTSQEVAKTMIINPDDADHPAVGANDDQQTDDTTAQQLELVQDDDTAGDVTVDPDTSDDDLEIQATDDTTTNDGADDDDAGAFDDAFELDADTLVPVTVDGETIEVTLAELAKRYSGEGAIDKRLQDVAEERNAVTAERQQLFQERQTVQQERQNDRQNLLRTIQTMESYLFAPRVEKPNAALQATNPQQYLLQQSNYQEDQQRIHDLRGEVGNLMQGQAAQQAQQKQHDLANAAQELTRLMPELRDPKKGPAVQQEIVAGAEAYGFSQQELQMVTDPRMFVVLRDAARHRALQSSSTVRPTRSAGNRVKPMTPTGRRPATSAAKKEEAQRLKRARTSGKTSDVAKTMLVRKPRRE